MNNHLNEAAFGSVLRKTRRAAGENLETLANDAGVSIAYVSKIERGEKNPPSDEVIASWLRLLGCEERLVEFLNLARQSVKTIQVAIKHEDPLATDVLTALARAYEDPDGAVAWNDIQKIILRKKGKAK